MRFWQGWLLLGLFSAALQGTESTIFPVSFKKGVDQEFDTSAIPSFFKVARFESSVDGMVTPSELATLMNLLPGSYLTREQFLKGIARVRQKEKLSHAQFTFEHLPEGVVIRCKAECDWIMRSLKCKGISVGKDEYTRLYEISVGDLFTFQKHEHSLNEIRHFLGTRGYKNAKITDRVTYEPLTKTVMVHLTLEKKKAFIIKESVVHIQDPQACFPESERVILKKKFSALTKKVCKEETIERITKEIKKWLQEKGYRESTIEKKETIYSDQAAVMLEFFVKIPGRKKVTFFGNHYFSSHELRHMLFEFAATEIFLPATIAAQELESEYRKKGFWNASVESNEDGDDQEFFVIKEGPRIALKKVFFKGVDQYEESWLEKEFFKEALHARFFDETKLEAALHGLIAWYKQQGFWDCKVLKKEYEPLESGNNKYCLLLTLDEGKRRFLSDLVVEGLPEVPEGLALYGVLKAARQPVPLASQVLSLQQQFLAKKLRKEGYLHARVQQKLEDTQQGIVVTWECQKGKQVKFGKTIVRGYTKIPYERLVKLLAYQEGEVWNKEKIQQSLGTLRSLDIFERVSLFPSFKDLADDERDTILIIKDDDPFEVKVRVGFAQVSKNFYFKKGSTYKAGGSFIWKNPRGQADRLALDIDFNRFERKINAAYKLPFFFDFPLSTVLKVYSNKYIQPVVIGSSKPLYQVLQEGFLLGLSKKYSHCDLGFTSGFEWMETTDISLELARAINFETSLVNKKIPYFFLEPMAYADFLDDKINPTTGFFGLAALKGMFPFKESSFLIKVMAEQGSFVPLNIAVLAMRFRAGHIFRRKFNAIMPPERFFLGGPNSLRGYLQDYCPPLGTYVDDEGREHHVPQGGKTMLNANFELRIPFKQRSLWATVFQDFGILMEDPWAIFTAGNPLAATGFGIRYITPVGPLRFDIGWKWHKSRPEDTSYAWFLTFGNAF